MLEIWPAILVAGLSFAIPQFLVSNYHGPWLVDVVSAMISMACLTLFLRVWRPATIWTSTALERRGAPAAVPSVGAPTANPVRGPQHERKAVLGAWVPWVILTVFVFLWGVPEFRKVLDGVSVLRFPIEGLNDMIQRVPPVVAKPQKEAAVYVLNWLSATGSGILLAAVIAGFFMKFSPLGLARVYWSTIVRVRYSLLTISAMLALGFLTRYSGTDATMGLAFATAGVFYPFFGAMLGWMGVAVTGSDTASNVLFGGLQKITAEQLGLNPVLMAAANSSGGVMGKMIDAQSIVVASTATQWFGHEGEILRYVFFHSLVLAALVGLVVTAQAYWYPFTLLVVGH
jgi:lactate permease